MNSGKISREHMRLQPVPDSDSPPWLRRAAAGGRRSRGYRPGAGQLTGRLTRRPARPSVQRVAGGGEEPVGEGEAEWLIFSVLHRNFYIR